MTLLTSPKSQMTPRRMSMAAESIAAAQFALCGFDVLEQAGQARYSYDLGIANSSGMLKVSVHGSQGGFWDLVEPFLARGDRASATREERQRAIRRWLAHQSAQAAVCLVQFESDDLQHMPRLYLATAEEIATKLLDNVAKMSNLQLYEFGGFTDLEWTDRFEGIPAAWHFSRSRIEELMEAPAGKLPLTFRFSGAGECSACAAARPAACVKCLPMMN